MSPTQGEIEAQAYFQYMELVEPFLPRCRVCDDRAVSEEGQMCGRCARERDDDPAEEAWHEVGDHAYHDRKENPNG